MSTRANIILSFTDYEQTLQSKIILYRHCDGYPKETGKDIINILDSIKERKYLTNLYSYQLPDIFNAFMEKNKNFPENLPCYSLTDSIHGDIEYCYEVAIHLKKHVLPVDEYCDKEITTYIHTPIIWEANLKYGEDRIASYKEKRVPYNIDIYKDRIKNYLN
jgi:hypothetical protein